MRAKLATITAVTLASMVAGAVGIAPLASAESSLPAPTCSQSGPGTQCQSPGNVQFNDAPAPVQFYPYGGEGGLIGGGGERP
ncbi:MAG: hypothetical protein ABW137_30015 [Mycobacterium sp.]